jgi:hypothetical protein
MSWCKLYHQNKFFLLEPEDSVVGIATSNELGDRRVGVRVPVRSRIFSSPRRPDRLWDATQLPIQWVRGGSFPGGKAARA